MNLRLGEWLLYIVRPTCKMSHLYLSPMIILKLDTRSLKRTPTIVICFFIVSIARLASPARSASKIMSCSAIDSSIRPLPAIGGDEMGAVGHVGGGPHLQENYCQTFGRFDHVSGRSPRNISSGHLQKLLHGRFHSRVQGH